MLSEGLRRAGVMHGEPLCSSNWNDKHGPWPDAQPAQNHRVDDSNTSLALLARASTVVESS